MSRYRLIRRRALSAALIITLASPGVAQARLWLDPPAAAQATHPTVAISSSGPGMAKATPVAARAASTGAAAASGSFDWGDAAIGAAGASLVLVGSAGAATRLARRRGQRLLVG
ncbi:MAG: hypothetical protein WBQ18_07895 [Solirubrobacteraceae bacterium]